MTRPTSTPSIASRIRVRLRRELDRRLPVPVKRYVYAGSRHVCPCCQSSLRAFREAWISDGHPNVQCPVCGSLERHRLMAFLLAELARPGRLLHFAPETAMRHVWARSPMHVVTLDYLAAGVDVRGDITRLPFPGSSFDGLVCSHVLEHIPDDAAAMRELRRVLKPGGWALVVVPLHQLPTYEDWSITSPEGRLAAFGQFDHVRVYGFDVVERLSSVGFAVEPRDPYAAMTADERTHYGLAQELLLLCRPDRRAAE